MADLTDGNIVEPEDLTGAEVIRLQEALGIGDKASTTYVDSQDTALQTQIDSNDVDITDLETNKANITYVDAQDALKLNGSVAFIEFIDYGLSTLDFLGALELELGVGFYNKDGVYSVYTSGGASSSPMTNSYHLLRLTCVLGIIYLEQIARQSDSSVNYASSTITAVNSSTYITNWKVTDTDALQGGIVDLEVDVNDLQNKTGSDIATSDSDSTSIADSIASASSQDLTSVLDNGGDSTIDNKVAPISLYGDEVVSPNLLTPENTILESYVTPTGTFRSYSSGSTSGRTDYIDVSLLSTIYFYAYTTSLEQVGCFFDSSFVFVENLSQGDASLISTNNYVVTKPPTAQYFILNFAGSQYDDTYIKESIGIATYNLDWLKLNAKNYGDFDNKASTWVGDSITQGTGVTSSDNRYSYLISQEVFVGGAYTNLGVGGSTIADYTGAVVKSFFERIVTDSDIPSSQDYIFILGGVNDFAQDIPISYLHTELDYYDANGSYQTDTFYGAWLAIIDYIRTNNEQAKLIVITTWHYKNEMIENTEGHVLQDYIDAERYIAEYFALPCIDLYKELGVDTKDTYQSNTYTMNGSLTAPDGTHPNDKGNRLFADKIKSDLFNKFQYLGRTL